MVMSLRACRWAKAMRSGILAMVPSSFMISQMTPAGYLPAIRAKSTEPSVWPARLSTPPLWARKGKMCPGLVKSEGLQERSTAIRIVVARSAAEIPVVTSRAASMDTVKAVPNGAVFAAV